MEKEVKILKFKNLKFNVTNYDRAREFKKQCGIQKSRLFGDLLSNIATKYVAHIVVHA